MWIFRFEIFIGFYFEIHFFIQFLVPWFASSSYIFIVFSCCSAIRFFFVWVFILFSFSFNSNNFFLYIWANDHNSVRHCHARDSMWNDFVTTFVKGNWITLKLKFYSSVLSDFSFKYIIPRAEQYRIEPC